MFNLLYIPWNPLEILLVKENFDFLLNHLTNWKKKLCTNLFKIIVGTSNIFMNLENYLSNLKIIFSWARNYPIQKWLKKERGNWISAQPATEPVPSCYARTARSCQWQLLVSGNQQLGFFYWCHQPAADGSSSSLCLDSAAKPLCFFPDYEPPLLELLGYCLPSSPSEPCIDLRLLRKASSHFFLHFWAPVYAIIELLLGCVQSTLSFGRWN